jgi:hypothetical protein
MRYTSARMVSATVFSGDMAGSLLWDSTQALTLGTSAATSHGLGVGDVLIGGDLEVDGTTYFDGTVQLQNNGGNPRIHFGTSTGTTYHIGEVADSMYYQSAYGGHRLVHGSDWNTVSRGVVEIGQANANSELTASSGRQYGIAVGCSNTVLEIAQSGTAGFSAIYSNVTDTSSGSGQDYALDLNWGGSPVFQVQDDGGIFTNLPTSNPGVAGYLWVDTTADYVVKVSQG